MVAPEAAHILVLRHGTRSGAAATRFHSLVDRRMHWEGLVAEHSIPGSDLVVDIEEGVRVDNRLVYMVVVPSNVCRT